LNGVILDNLTKQRGNLPKSAATEASPQDSPNSSFGIDEYY